MLDGVEIAIEPAFAVGVGTDVVVLRTGVAADRLVLGKDALGRLLVSSLLCEGRRSDRRRERRDCKQGEETHEQNSERGRRIVPCWRSVAQLDERMRAARPMSGRAPRANGHTTVSFRGQSSSAEETALSRG